MLSLLSSLRSLSLRGSPSSLSVAAPAPIGPSIRSVSVGSLKPSRGSRKRKIRYGRGEGQGTGEGKGRGNNGTGARVGKKYSRGFEGGQTPLTKLYPKWGFFNVGRKFYQPVSLGTLQEYIDLRRLDPTETITVEHIYKSNLCHGFKQANGFKLLASGFEQLKQPIHIRPHRASIAAIKAIEATGGSVTTVYHNRLSFRQAIHPEKFRGHRRIQEALPMKKRDILYYTNWEKRGYLAKKPEEAEKESDAPKEFVSPAPKQY
ncbi:Mitochondrial/chloroplast ribosomal protein L15/L10 [Phaffia rhodozyma]|uniref:Mitochondrial/chloroplast ribosomal protein L15/L10 n=1 Tax=Phaffia rhodozyma TaxID=264483 RepID=A0A0F7SFF3_PHARH|nr:Mitochondrial/chloroplast ribosomal protein L15/L10 [Phaffia rhodozyma]